MEQCINKKEERRSLEGRHLSLKRLRENNRGTEWDVVREMGMFSKDWSWKEEQEDWQSNGYHCLCPHLNHRPSFQSIDGLNTQAPFRTQRLHGPPSKYPISGGKENKSKNELLGPHQNKKILHSEGNNQQN